MLISDKTIEAVNRLTQRMFIHNRTLDNILGYSSIEWAFVEFDKVYHDGFAHLMPLVGDVTASMLKRYNVVPKYYDTPADLRVYSNPLEAFETNLDEFIETYKMIKSAIDIAVSEGDINIESDLKALMRMWNRFIDQSIVLVDKAKVYNGNLWAYDAHCSQWYLLSDIADQLNGNNTDE